MRMINTLYDESQIQISDVSNQESRTKVDSGGWLMSFLIQKKKRKISSMGCQNI